MEFKSIFSVTGADHSDEDLTTAAGLCAEVGAHLSVLIIPPPLLLMSSPPPNGIQDVHRQLQYRTIDFSKSRNFHRT